MHVQYAIQDKEKQFYIIQSLYCTCEVNNMVYILPCRKGWTVSSSYTNWLDGESTFEHDWQLVLEFLQLQIFLKFPSNLLFLASQAQLGKPCVLLRSMEFLALIQLTISSKPLNLHKEERIEKRRLFHRRVIDQKLWKITIFEIKAIPGMFCVRRQTVILDSTMNENLIYLSLLILSTLLTSQKAGRVKKDNSSTYIPYIPFFLS